MSNVKNIGDKRAAEMLTSLHENDNLHKKRVLRKETDHCNLRNADYIQTYNWQFFLDSLDGEREFAWFIHPLKHVYEDSISVNAKEGYGRISYPCGSYFEGLFLNNERFGPGVYTNSAGEQDVGIWLGNKLVRLIRSLPEMKILRIAREREDKIKILKHRTIILLNQDRWQNIARNLINNNTSDLDRVNINLWKKVNDLCSPVPKDVRSLWHHILDHEYVQKYLHKEKESITTLPKTDMEVSKAIRNNTTRQSYLSASKVINNEDTIEENKQPNDVRLGIEDSDATFLTNQHSEELMNVDDESHGDQFYCGIKGFNEEDQMNNFEDKWHIFANIDPNDFTNIDNTINNWERRKSQTSTLNFDEFDRVETTIEFPTKTTVMTHLLAWNNNRAMIDILKHVFRYRNDEKKLRYKIHKILAGERGEFRQEGPQEMAALNFLIASSNGFKNKIRQIILKEKVDVNLADNVGNTGLIYAAASDRLQAIDTLLDLGADINCVNDECLTPLSLCVLRLLESVHRVVNLAKAFLPRNVISIDLKQSDFIINDQNDNNTSSNLQEWCPRSVFSYEQIPIKIYTQGNDYSILRDMSNRSKKTMQSNVYEKWRPTKSNTSIKMIGRDVIHHIESRWKLQNDIRKNNMNLCQSIKEIKETLDTHGDLSVLSNINLEGMKYNQLSSSSLVKQSEKSLSVPSQESEIQNYIFNWNAIPEVSSNLQEKIDRKKENKRGKSNEINRDIEKETKIYNTILKLLSRGADPNCSTTPYPVLIMAIFSKSTDLVQKLLLHGADPNVTLSQQEYSLAPLHILAVIKPSLENSIIAKSLICANADINLRTDSTYRPDVKARVSEYRSMEFLNDNEGLTALHLLALRSDYQTDTDQYLRQLLCGLLWNGSNTSHALYQGHNAPSLAIVEGNIDALKLLLETGVINVNEQLGYDLGNCMLMIVSRRMQEKLSVSFLEESIQLLLKFGGCPLTRCKVLDRDYNQLEYAREELHSVLHKSSKNFDDTKRNSELEEHEHEKESLRTINKHFVEIIIFLENVARDLMKRRIRANIVKKMVNIGSCIRMDASRTKSRFDDNITKFASAWMSATELVYTMRIMKYSHEDIKKVLIAYLESKLQKISTSNNTIAADARRIISEVFHNDGTNDDEYTQYSIRHIIYPPETDPDVKKFMVCYECFMVHNKVLIWCPTCRLVLFCSQTCNINNTRRSQNPHTCKVFYDEELKNLEKMANLIGVNPREFVHNNMLKTDNDEIVKDVHKYNRNAPKKNNNSQKWKWEPHDFLVMPDSEKPMLNGCGIRKVNVKNEVEDMEFRNYYENKGREENNLPNYTDEKHHPDDTNYYKNLESNINQINKKLNQASPLKPTIFNQKHEIPIKTYDTSLNANLKHYANYLNDEESVGARGKKDYVMGDETQGTSKNISTPEKLNTFDISIKKAQRSNNTYKHKEELGDDTEKITQEIYKLKKIQENELLYTNNKNERPLQGLMNLKNENASDKGKRNNTIGQSNDYFKIQEKHVGSRFKKKVIITSKNRYTRTAAIENKLKKINQQKKQLFSDKKEERQLLQNKKRLSNIKKYKIMLNNPPNISAVWLLECGEFMKELNAKTLTLSYIAFSNGDIYYSNKQIDRDTKSLDNYSLL